MASKESYWAKVLFKEVIRHFRKLSDQEILNDIKMTMDALEDNDPNKNCFGSKMVQWANERKEVYKNNAIAGSLGGKARANSEKQNVLPAKLPEQLTYGACENVYLTQEQFNDLATRVGNLKKANELIDNLSYKLADGTFKSENHFATLCYWNDCRKQKEENNTRPMTFREIDEQNEIKSIKKFGIII